MAHHGLTKFGVNKKNSTRVHVGSGRVGSGRVGGPSDRRLVSHSVTQTFSNSVTQSLVYFILSYINVDVLVYVIKSPMK